MFCFCLLLGLGAGSIWEMVLKKAGCYLHGTDCIIVELKVLEVDLCNTATKTEVSCPGKPPPDTGIHRKRTQQSSAVNSKLTIWGTQALPEKDPT